MFDGRVDMNMWCFFHILFFCSCFSLKLSHHFEYDCFPIRFMIFWYLGFTFKWSKDTSKLAVADLSPVQRLRLKTASLVILINCPCMLTYDSHNSHNLIENVRFATIKLQRKQSPTWVVVSKRLHFFSLFAPAKTIIG